MPDIKVQEITNAEEGAEEGWWEYVVALEGAGYKFLRGTQMEYEGYGVSIAIFEGLITEEDEIRADAVVRESMSENPPNVVDVFGIKDNELVVRLVLTW